ncbi:helix-turn-helix domain-containing protein [Candidatus Uhrbacteria bacterium]|nr:helix-turn-helix domain-containing protein [Candidatus Uhrbacteria bacterium]
MSFVHKHLGVEGRFGGSLRELRELRGFTREELSERTRIHPSIIAAFEEERLNELTDPMYAERHVRTLAAALEGRPGYFLQKYRQLLVELGLVSADVMRVRPTVRRRDFFVTSRVVAVLGFLAIAAAGGGYVFWQAYLLQDPPPLRIFTPQDGAEFLHPRVSVQGETAPNALVTVNGARAVVSPDGQFRIEFDIPRGVSVISVEARRRYGSPVRQVRHVTYGREMASSDEVDLRSTSTISPQ